MQNPTRAALVLGLLSLTLLVGCGRGSAARVTPGGIAAGIIGEAIYDGLKSHAAWRAGQPHPTAPNVVSTAAYGVWQPAPGMVWTDTQTTEPRRLR